jgi:hypothetical protein
MALATKLLAHGLPGGAFATDAGGGGNPLEPDVFVGSWELSEIGRWFPRALADYRGTPQYVEWRETELYRAFLTAVTTYDLGSPYPPLHPEWAQRFLNWLRHYGG